MTQFCPEGYLPTPQAVLRATEYWFPDAIAALQSAVVPEQQTQPKSNFDAAVRAFSQPSIPDTLQLKLREVANQTVQRLRNFLHQSKLKVYYFTEDGRQYLPCDFWATAGADGVLESGTYWPFGEPTRPFESRRSHSLFLMKTDLDALLSERTVQKRLPRAKEQELAGAYRLPEIAALPNRKAQREAIRALEQFRQYRITDRHFRTAEKASGARVPGVKKRQRD